MLDLFSMVKRLLRGEFSFDLGRGELVFKGRRIVAMPADSVEPLVEGLYEILGDGALVVMEKLGEAMGKSTRETMGWSSGDEVLKSLPDVAKLAGFGIVKVSGDQLVFENLPVRITPAVLRYLGGFFRGLCIELLDVSAEETRLAAKVRVVC